MPKIEILDNVHCKANKEAKKLIGPAMSYSSKYATKARFGTRIVRYEAKLIERNGQLLLGHLPRLKVTYPEIEIIGEPERLEPTKKSYLKGITPWGSQSRLVENALQYQRGVLLSPTGSGKTVVAMLLMSQFPKAKILFLCHSFPIISQTALRMKEHGFKNIQILGDGNNTFDKKSRITVSTIQTFSKLDPDKFAHFFDITIVDEAHHCNSRKGSYGKVMGINMSPIKIGLTATLPNDKKSRLCLEGLIGPVIDEYTMKEGIENKIVVKPTVKLIPVTYSQRVGDFYKYQDIYNAGIVENRARNRLIVQEAKEQVESGKTVLIMVKEIAHGENIVSIGKLLEFDIDFVQGGTEQDIKKSIQDTLESKDTKCVVCTAVWREGIDIKSLNTVILALGGKSAIQTVQAVGRGLRKSKGKTEVLLIDFLDCYKYLARHAVHRITLYVKNGWI
jgi:superfamily II DNA or RNA helicase